MGVSKKDCQLGQNLVLGETGLGRDSKTGAIAASYDWWDLKLMRHLGCAKFRDKPLPLEDEMRILFGSNTATGEHKYTPSLGFLPAAPGVRITPNVDPENIDALLDDDDEIQELVHPTESLKKRRANNSVAKKTIPNGKKVLKAGNFCHQMSGSATSRLEACLQQINSTDSASSPSVQRSVDIPTLKEAADALNELPEFKDDSDVWVRAFNILGGAKQRALFMACPDQMKRYYWFIHEMTRVQKAKLGNSN